MRRLTGSLTRARRQVADDLRADPYLVYILLFATVLCGFWIWHRVPNFATRDERWRVVDMLEAVGFYIEDPSLSSLREGVTFWRSYGATFYLYGLALLPLLCYLVLTGELAQLTGLSKAWSVDHWTYWHILPSRVWTVAILSARLVNVALAVGCVYLVYRIGTMLRDRATGRLAALVLALTWGVVVLAHEAGEDIPALFFLLLTFAFALKYVQTGTSAQFLWGCLFGGIAIAFKLTAGIGVFLLAGAYVLRAHRPETTPTDALVRPLLLIAGAIVGCVTIYVGYPSAVTGGTEVFFNRVIRGTTAKSETHGWLRRPSWWWILRGYLNGLGLPLFVGSIGAVAAALGRLRERSLETAGVILSLLGIGTPLLVFSQWAYVRTHHLVLTFPFLAVLLAVALRRIGVRRPQVARATAIALLVTSAVYTGVGDLGYANQSRDQAEVWLDDRANASTTIETYTGDPQDTAIPYEMSVYRPTTPNSNEWTLNMPERCPMYIQLNYQTAFMYLAPETHSVRAGELSNPQLQRYYRNLLAENIYPYEVAATFGREPWFVRENDHPTRAWEILRAGIYPRSIQYGDPQDFGHNQYTVILERTDPNCWTDG